VRRLAALAVACAALASPVAALAAEPAIYDVGFGVRSINPGKDGLFGGEKVYLGGYGIGGGTQFTPGRWATGVLDDPTGRLGHGLDVRALAIGDGKRMIVLADAALQGWFTAQRDGETNAIVDVRKDIEKKTGGAVKATDIVVQSDHSHSGPDLIGPWGGTSEAYRKYVKDQTEAAILDAIADAKPSSLWYGAVDAKDLLRNQFEGDPTNADIDGELRVLQARTPGGGAVRHTLLNFSAHATVLGSQPYASGDWPQAANPMLEAAFGGDAITVVGTLGRTQPQDGNTCNLGDEDTHPEQSFCELESYATKVVARTKAAVAAAQPIAGEPKVGSAGYLIQDPGTNAFLLALLYGGKNTGMPVNRSDQAPWLTGNLVGTSTTSMRIGDVLLSAGPGEMYPQIVAQVRAQMPNIRGYMTAGLANDQLGYLIAPLEAYGEPMATTAAALANDNYAFNVSHTMGERVTCSLLRGAGEVFARGTAPRDAYTRCAAFVNDMQQPAGSDTGG
jgi:hypothetical protein